MGVGVKYHDFPMSYMNRSDGLVQRRNLPKETAFQQENDPDEEKPVYSDEEEDQDSKETRLTLMEEVLLLGLKDREVSVSLSCNH